MEVILLLLLTLLGVMAGCPYNNPLKHRPMFTLLKTTPFYGYNFLKHQPAMKYKVVPTLQWVKDVNEFTSEDVSRLKRDIVKHGVIRISAQNLTRKQQMIFSGKLGKVIMIPKSFRGSDFHPDYPSISPVRNFWQNGTWKGNLHSFGQYWHKDGDFWSFDNGYILSILYADEYDEGILGGETAFIDGCLLRRDIPKDIENNLKKTKISLSVRDIPDFFRGSEEDFNMFPQVHHKVIFKHPDKNEECVFLTLQNMNYKKDVRNLSILRLWDFMQNPKYIMIQNWRKGDLIIWDNYGVFHRAMPFVNNQKRRILFRTQVGLDTGKQTK